MPRRGLMSRYWLSRGLRMSRPTRIVRLPIMANEAARLMEMNVFPSPDVDDVSMITFSSGVPSMNCVIVERIRRNSSAAEDVLSGLATIVSPLLSMHISPRIGTSVMRSTSCRVSKRFRRVLRRYKIVGGIHNPNSMAKRIMAFFGRPKGLLSLNASSMITPFGTALAITRAFSSRL